VANTTPVIEITDLSKRYQTGDEETIALDGVNLTINDGEFVAIMGPSGSGKSTLMHIIGLLDGSTGGIYRLDGVDVGTLSKSKQADIRNQKIGFIFQQFNLLPRTTVVDNILLPTVYGDARNAEKRVDKLLTQMGLEERAGHLSNQLSGGQIQRVAIARALINNPSIILADEPTGNLDSKRSHEIMSLLKTINRDGATIILITHEKDVADYADRVVQIWDGRVTELKVGVKS
jgi:ABC-type lipoprotein export system ATPase subunit